MSIPFTGVPADTRVPFAYFEIDPSKANTAAQVQRTLIIGQRLSSGSAPAGVPVRGQDSGKVAGGAGSMLAIAAAAYRRNDPTGEVWFLALDDAGGASKATGSIALTGPVTTTGTLALYVAGTLLPLVLVTGTGAPAAATALVAAINAAVDLPVLAAIDGVNTAKVNLTAKNAGVAAGDIDLRINYLGAAGGELLPVGLGVTITAMSGGAGNPSLTAGLASLGDMPFDFILCPYTDAGSLSAMKAFLDFTSGRWMPTRQVFGHAFAAADGTASDVITIAGTANDPHLTLLPTFDSPSSTYTWAAAFMGAAAVSLRADPALPLQTVGVLGLLAPTTTFVPAFTQRNVLLHAGVSTYTVGPAGDIAIENMISTYQQNAAGQADNSYLELETLFTLAAVIRRLRGVVQTKFGRVKLAADGARLIPGTNVVTPAIIKAELIAAYRQMEQEDGWVQQSAAFAAGLVVQKSTTTPGRVDALLPAILIEQLRVFAALVQFRLF